MGYAKAKYGFLTKSFAALILAAVLMFVFTTIAYGQATTPPETIEGATALVPQLIEALLKGNYNVVGGIVLMIGMVALRQFALPIWKIPSDVLPIVSALIGALSLAGLSVTTGVEVGEALKNGLVISLLAGGTWSLVGKWITKLILGNKYQEPVS